MSSSWSTSVGIYSGLDDYNSNKKKATVMKLNSFIISLMIMTPYLNVFIPTILPITSPGNMFGVLVTFLFSYSIYKNGVLRINFLLFTFLFYIGTFFIISLVSQEFNSISLTIFTDFLYFGVLPMLIINQGLLYKQVLKYTILLSIIPIINFPEFLQNSRVSETSNVVLMGYSYAFLPSVIASVIYFIYFRKDRSVLLIMGYLLNIYLLWTLLTGGTRGGFVSIGFMTILLLISQFKNGKHKTYKWSLWIIFAATALVVSYFNTIVKFLYNFTADRGISINIINKTFIKSQSGSILNGRENLYPAAFEGFASSPAWGLGIGNFNINYGIYPHNLILQLLYEGGLLLTIPIIWVILVGMIWVLSKKNNNLELSMLIIFLSSVSIPRLMFSANFWNTQSFWMLFGIIITQLMDKNYGLNSYRESIIGNINNEGKIKLNNEEIRGV